MSKTVYVPYSGQSPQPLLVKGHRLLVLADSREVLEGHLVEVAADRVVEFEFRNTREQEEFLTTLAEGAKASLVMAPTGLDFDELMKGLASQLPWLH